MTLSIERKAELLDKLQALTRVHDRLYIDSYTLQGTNRQALPVLLWVYIQLCRRSVEQDVDYDAPANYLQLKGIPSEQDGYTAAAEFLKLFGRWFRSKEFARGFYFALEDELPGVTSWFVCDGHKTRTCKKPEDPF